MSFNRVSTDGLDAFRQISTSTISDALDRLGLPGAILGLRPVVVPPNRICGQTVTLLYMSAGVNGGNVGDYMDVPQAGDILALDNRGRVDCTVWGDILTEVALQKGLAGTVIDGINRDIDAPGVTDYPVFSRGVAMRTGKDRVTLEGVNVPIILADVRVDPGDILVADGSGVVAVPHLKAEEVLAVAAEIEERENGMGTTAYRVRGYPNDLFLHV